MTDSELDFVLHHPVTSIVILHLMPPPVEFDAADWPVWRELTPDQLCLIGGRMVQWQEQPESGLDLVRMADVIADPHATMPIDEVLAVLDSPVMRLLFQIDGPEELNPRQIARVGEKLEAFAEQLIDVEHL